MSLTVPLAVRYSTPRAEAVSTFVTDHYDVPGQLDCTFLRRGFNDTFEIRAQHGHRSILRLSGWRPRGEADVASETAFLSYLAAEGVPVCAAMPTRDGTLFTHAFLPEGRRPAVLFGLAEGAVPAPAPADARSQGATLARIHVAAEGFADRDAGRYRLDLDHLLHRPVGAILELGILSAEQRTTLADIVSRLSAMVGVQDGLTWTRCHGDCHGGNARIATEGPHAGQAVFFDFDDGGPGYLAYDLAVFLWAQVSFGRSGHRLWHAFIDGYRSVRAITPVDFEAAHIFVPIRHLWLLGDYAARTGEWGTEAVPAGWLGQQLDFILAWERDKLSEGLLAR